MNAMLVARSGVSGYVPAFTRPEAIGPAHATDGHPHKPATDTSGHAEDVMLTKSETENA